MKNRWIILATVLAFVALATLGSGIALAASGDRPSSSVPRCGAGKTATPKPPRPK